MADESCVRVLSFSCCPFGLLSSCLFSCLDLCLDTVPGHQSCVLSGSQHVCSPKFGPFSVVLCVFPMSTATRRLCPFSGGHMSYVCIFLFFGGVSSFVFTRPSCLLVICPGFCSQPGDLNGSEQVPAVLGSRFCLSESGIHAGVSCSILNWLSSLSCPSPR